MHFITIRSIIALLQGALLSILYFSNQAPAHWPATDPYIFVPITTIAIFIPLLLIQSIGNMRFKTLCIWATVAAVIVGGIAFYAVFRQLPDSQRVDAFPFFSVFLFLFIAHSLMLGSDTDKRFIARYPTYFDISWKLAVQTAFATAFALAFWILLWLGAELFEIIGLPFFKNLISKAWFAIPATALAVAIAIHITDVKAVLINGIRTLILVLLSWLLPLITAIVSLFLLSLPFTGITAFWQNGSNVVLLIAVALHLIILINAAYQDGQNSLPAIQRYSMRIACCLLTPIVIIAICALQAKAQQSGWLVQYIYAAFSLLIIAFYAVAYLWSALKNQQKNILETGNIIIAYLILVVILALLTPLADPARLTVADQLSRLRSGKITPNEFNYFALRSTGARFGQQALENLQTWNGPHAPEVQAQAKAALTAKDLGVSAYAQAVPIITTETKNKLITVHNKDNKLPADFIKQNWNQNTYAVEFVMMPACLVDGSRPCHAWIIDTQVQLPMIIILDNNIFTGFQKNTQGTWSAIGNWIIPNTCQNKIQAATEGKFKTVPSIMPDIEINGWRVYFEPRRNRACE